MWNALKAVQLFFLLLVATGWIARYLPPDIFWWAALVAIFLPYTTLGLVPGLVLSFVSGQRWWTWISLGGFLLGASRVFFFPSPKTFSEQHTVSLRIMTYNYQPRSGSVYPGREGLLQLVKGQQPHILALQEAEYWYRDDGKGVATVGIQEVIDSLAYRLIRPDGVQKKYEQPLLVSPELHVRKASQYRFAYGLDDRAPAVVTRAEIEWDGGIFALYNIHLRSFGSAKPWREDEKCWVHPSCWLKYLRMYRDAYRKRAFEVRQIRRLIHVDSLPVVVVGDLNSTPYNWSYAQIRGSLVDVYERVGRWPGFTYHSKQPFVRIDVIGSDPSFVPERAAVIKVKFSDHFPVVADIRWRKGL